MEREIAFLKDQNAKRAGDIAVNARALSDQLDASVKDSATLFQNDETLRKAINQHRAILGWQQIPKEGE